MPKPLVMGNRLRLLFVALGGAALLAGLGTDSSSGTTNQAADAPRPAPRPSSSRVEAGDTASVIAQWGAYGFAQQGSTYDEILAHYYTGTSLGPAPVSSVRVLLAEGNTMLTVSSLSNFRVGTPRARRTSSPPVRSRSEPVFGSSRPAKQQRRAPARPAPLHRRGVAAPAGQPSVPWPAPGLGGQWSSSRRQHRRPRGLPLRCRPSEMPYTWVAEALKAQAVAARTYALAVRKTGSYFDLYSDTRSQVYLGSRMSSLRPRPRSRRPPDRSCSTRAPRHDLLLLELGRANRLRCVDAWPGSPELPYLASVDDPYDSISPHHEWGPVLRRCEAPRPGAPRAWQAARRTPRRRTLLPGPNGDRRRLARRRRASREPTSELRSACARRGFASASSRLRLRRARSRSAGRSL